MFLFGIKTACHTHSIKRSLHSDLLHQKLWMYDSLSSSPNKKKLQGFKQYWKSNLHIYQSLHQVITCLESSILQIPVKHALLKDLRLSYVVGLVPNEKLSNLKFSCWERITVTSIKSKVLFRACSKLNSCPLTGAVSMSQSTISVLLFLLWS